MKISLSVLSRCLYIYISKCLIHQYTKHLEDIFDQWFYPLAVRTSMLLMCNYVYYDRMRNKFAEFLFQEM